MSVRHVGVNASVRYVPSKTGVSTSLITDTLLNPICPEYDTKLLNPTQETTHGIHTRRLQRDYS